MLNHVKVMDVSRSWMCQGNGGKCWKQHFMGSHTVLDTLSLSSWLENCRN